MCVLEAALWRPVSRDMPVCQPRHVIITSRQPPLFLDPTQPDVTLVFELTENVNVEMI